MLFANIATSDNQKLLMFPMEAGSTIGSIAGIGEIIKEEVPYIYLLKVQNRIAISKKFETPIVALERTKTTYPAIHI